MRHVVDVVVEVVWVSGVWTGVAWWWWWTIVVVVGIVTRVVLVISIATKVVAPRSFATPCVPLSSSCPVLVWVVLVLTSTHVAKKFVDLYGEIMNLSHD